MLAWKIVGFLFAQVSKAFQDGGKPFSCGNVLICSAWQNNLQVCKFTFNGVLGPF